MTLQLIHKAPRFTGVDRPPREEPWRAIHRAADQRAPALERRLLEWLRGLTLDREAALVWLERSDPGMVASRATDWDLAGARLERVLLEPLRDAFDAGGQVAWRTTEPTTVEKQGLVGVFDLFNPRAIFWAASHAAELVTNTIVFNQMAIRDIILLGQREGLGLPGQAFQILRLLQDGMGLDRVRAGAVARFRLRLTEEGLASGLIDQRTADLRERYLKQRAHVIARNETITAAGAGQHEAWLQAVERGLLLSSQTRRWVAALDERVCPICGPPDGYHGTEAPLDQPFINERGESALHPPGHVSCRCVAVLVT